VPLPDPDRKIRRARERFEADVARDPGDAHAYVNMALFWHWSLEYANALELYSGAIRIGPAFPYALCARASLLATCPDSTYRDGDLAVRDATMALEGALAGPPMTLNWKRRLYRETVAAALAERGEFDAAVLMQREVLPFCMTRVSEKTAAARIAQFQAGQALRLSTGLVRRGIGRPLRV
jgi:tetratricopeptide (TPR) repeat protein